jgi:DNA-binding PadR family transcriptional regulator
MPYSCHGTQCEMPLRPVGHPGIVSPTQWLMLWLVIEEPSYTLELSARYDHLFGLFAPSRSQADSLKRLQELGLVEAVVQPAPKTRHRGRRAYLRATHAGKEAHRRWLSAGVKDERWRLELLTRIYTGATIGAAGLIELIKRYQSHALTEAVKVRARLEALTDGELFESLEALASRLVLVELQMTLATQRNFSEVALRAIEHYAERTSNHPSRRLH